MALSESSDNSDETRAFLRRTASLLADAHEALPRPVLSHKGPCGVRTFHDDCEPERVVRTLELLPNGDILAYCCRRHLTRNDPEYRTYRELFEDEPW